MPRWLPATEPETIKLVWLAAVNVQVSLVVSNPFAVTTTVPSPLLEPELTAPTDATVPVFSVSLVTPSPLTALSGTSNEDTADHPA